ncbi:MAG: hypothetical protein PF487_14600 [Bacteroidales bacterium]|jgi:hypothetical protein|nr:hypothetical protein [Bacteroidales bacterium]
MKHKKGDKVKINVERSLHFPLNMEVKIIIADPLSKVLRYCVENANGNSMWVSEFQVK